MSAFLKHRQNSAKVLLTAALGSYQYSLTQGLKGLKTVGLDFNIGAEVTLIISCVLRTGLAKICELKIGICKLTAG